MTSFKTHDLDVLLRLSGWEAKIKEKFPDQWLDLVDRWDTESRYKPPGDVSGVEAKSMIENVDRIVGALI